MSLNYIRLEWTKAVRYRISRMKRMEFLACCTQPHPSILHFTFCIFPWTESRYGVDAALHAVLSDGVGGMKDDPVKHFREQKRVSYASSSSSSLISSMTAFGISSVFQRWLTHSINSLRRSSSSSFVQSAYREIRLSCWIC